MSKPSEEELQENREATSTSKKQTAHNITSQQMRTRQVTTRSCRKERETIKLRDKSNKKVGRKSYATRRKSN